MGHPKSDPIYRTGMRIGAGTRYHVYFERLVIEFGIMMEISIFRLKKGGPGDSLGNYWTMFRIRIRKFLGLPDPYLSVSQSQIRLPTLISTVL
jgi:hypothetical protein